MSFQPPGPPAGMWADNQQRVVNRLNPWQRAIMERIANIGKPGWVRVIAAAGSGKTATTVATLSQILRDGSLSPGDIIATTFTRKAADELENRLRAVIETAKMNAFAPRVNTFHSIALAWLRKNDPAVPAHRWAPDRNLDQKQKAPNPGEDRKKQPRGLPRPSTIYDNILGDWPPIPGTRDPNAPGKEKRGLNLAARYGDSLPSAKDYILAIGVIRSYGLTPQDPEGIRRAEALQGERNRYDGKYTGPFPHILEIWRLYEESKRGLNAYDFEDALYAYWKRGTDRAKLIVVDEAQDNSWVQLDLARKIAERGNGRLVLVGDVRQSIYSWRGADPSIMQNADKDLGAETLEIPTNYRSGRRIVDIGNEICRGEPWSVGADAVAARKDTAPDGSTFTPEGDVSIRRGDDTSFAEASSTAASIRALLDAGEPPSSMSILIATNRQAAAYEMACLLNKVPVMVLGANSSFFDRYEVKNAIAMCLLSGQVEVPRVDLVDVLVRLFKVNKRRFKYLGKETFAALVDRAVTQYPKASAALLSLRHTPEFSRGRNVDQWQADLREFAAEVEAVEQAPWPETARVIANILAPEAPEEEPEAESSEAKEIADEVTSGGDDAGQGELIRAFAEIAQQFTSLPEMFEFAAKLSKWVMAVSNPGNLSGAEKAKFEEELKRRVVVSTIHKCVAPETYVETEVGGIVPAGTLVSHPEGVIGTPDGPRGYKGFVRYENRRMLRVTTEDGYEVSITDDHGMMAWTGERYERVEAHHLKVGQYLRLGLSAGVSDPEPPALPDPGDIPLDVRASRFALPRVLSVASAFLFGALVADGTIFKGGVRYTKAYADAAQAVATAFSEIGVPVEVTPRPKNNDYMVEICSTHIAEWLHLVGGMDPRAKGTPACILAAPRDMQVAYLRGLFSDGTVGVRGGKLDVVSLTTAYPRLATDTQYLLRRLGIIARRFPVPQHDHWRVEMYSVHARRFLEDIGFPDVRTERGLDARVPEEKNYTVPVSREEAGLSLSTFTKQNAKMRGYISRRVLARDLPILVDRLRYHHDRIAKIEHYTGPAVCVEVPAGSRFLQNGFDGWNSKGLEWGTVFVSATIGQLPHFRSLGDKKRLDEARRLFYVAVTRAENRLVLTCAETMERGGERRMAGPSEFVTEFVEPYLALRARGVPRWDDVAEYLSQAAPAGWALGSDRDALEPSSGPSTVFWLRDGGGQVSITEEPKRGELSSWGIERPGLATASATTFDAALRGAARAMRDDRPGTPTYSFADFVAFVASLSGEASPGVSWRQFARWLRENEVLVAPDLALIAAQVGTEGFPPMVTAEEIVEPALPEAPVRGWRLLQDDGVGPAAWALGDESTVTVETMDGGLSWRVYHDGAAIPDENGYRKFVTRIRAIDVATAYVETNPTPRRRGTVQAPEPVEPIIESPVPAPAPAVLTLDTVEVLDEEPAEDEPRPKKRKRTKTPPSEMIQVPPGEEWRLATTPVVPDRPITEMTNAQFSMYLRRAGEIRSPTEERLSNVDFIESRRQTAERMSRWFEDAYARSGEQETRDKAVSWLEALRFYTWLSQWRPEEPVIEDHTLTPPPPTGVPAPEPVLRRRLLDVTLPPTFSAQSAGAYLVVALPDDTGSTATVPLPRDIGTAAKVTRSAHSKVLAGSIVFVDEVALREGKKESATQRSTTYDFYRVTENEGEGDAAALVRLGSVLISEAKHQNEVYGKVRGLLSHTWARDALGRWLSVRDVPADVAFFARRLFETSGGRPFRLQAEGDILVEGLDTSRTGQPVTRRTFPSHAAQHVKWLTDAGLLSPEGSGRYAFTIEP